MYTTEQVNKVKELLEEDGKYKVLEADPETGHIDFYPNHKEYTWVNGAWAGWTVSTYGLTMDASTAQKFMNSLESDTILIKEIKQVLNID